MIFNFSFLIFLIHLIQLNCISFNESQKQDNKNQIKKIYNYMNLFQGRKLSFFEEEKKKVSYWLVDKFGDLLRREVAPIILNRTQNLSESCKNTLYNYLIYDINIEERNNISEYHLRKFFEGASKHKNDLSTYDICMYNNFGIKNDNNSGNFTNSVYFILTLDRSNLKKDNESYRYKKSSTEVEDIFYIKGFCFPQEKINNTDSCSEADYFNVLLQVNNDLNNIMGLNDKDNLTQYSYFVLKEEDYSNGEYFARILPLIILMIQFVIVFFRKIILKFLGLCCFKKEEKKIKERIIDTDENDEEENYLKNKNKDDSDIIRQKKEKKRKSIKYPKWLRVLSKSFNLADNFKELFNFSLNSTEINNDSGLTYIRGLKSFSFIFLIFGLTFFVFINSFSKTYSKSLMNEFLRYFFYIFFFVGLRYSPRIILSCSGYTLSYKYVSYIQKNSSIFGIFKFVLRQIHKYLLFILFFIFERYSLYLLSNSSNNISRPMWSYFHKNILLKPEGGMFLISFIDLTTIYNTDSNKRIEQTLIDYSWLPFNEIFFFIVGVILISIGYKYKWRIDIIILIIILLDFVGKIIYSYFKKTFEGEDYYATLYYYIFDYGKFMMHPLFNLSYFLIGMYFGLINYSVQKGITSLEVGNSNDYKAMVQLENMFIGDNNNKEEDKEEENESKDDESGKEETKEEKQLRAELIQLPFLKSGVRLIEWLKKISIRILGIVITLFLIIFCLSHYIIYYSIIGKEYDSLYEEIKSVNKKNSNSTKLEEGKEKIEDLYKDMDNLLLLSDFITNGVANFIFRIDIDIFVFLIQFLLFILYFKGQNFINDFFCHIFWGVLNKPYFSMIFLANPLILYIFYQSETRIILNFFNMLLYSIICFWIIFLFGSFTYLFYELPYKRLIHNLIYWDEQGEKKEENDEYNLNDNKVKHN